MTKAGKLELEFQEFKNEVLARLEALENSKSKANPKTDNPSKKSKDIIMETTDNDIVAKEE